jgi:ABC-type multidrug transport system ATPase subunit
MSILLSSQHLHEMERIADNIIFIKQGQALYNGKMKDFGKDRLKNLFELNTTADKAKIVAALQKLEGIRVEDRGNQQLIHSPTRFSGNEILGELVKGEVPIGYFRDISTSTLKLFRE